MNHHRETATPTPSDALRPDEPIRRMANDLLDRDALVYTLVDQIRRSDAAETLTIGLNAPWGAGKSSFLRFVAEALSKEEPREDPNGPSPIIVQFNPWLYGNVTELVRTFFGELARAIGTDKNDATRRAIGNLLVEFGPLVAKLAPAAPPVTGSFISRAGQIVRGEKSIPQQKKRLNKHLAKLGKQGHRVVVFVDDIDRLEADVVKLLFRLVRLTANFKNMTYVLAFDRAVVEEHLSQRGPASDRTYSGREYLEKIIQVSYDIPPPHPEVVRHILAHELAYVRAMDDNPLNWRRYDLIFKHHFADHFATVRHIKRYVNAVRLSLPPVAGKVDLVDFFVIELVRVFYPDVYLRLVRDRKKLVGPRRDEEAKARVDRSINKLSIPHSLRKSLETLIWTSFPGLARSGDDTVEEKARQLQWASDQRVCSSESVDRFFLFTVPTQELSASDVESFGRAMRGGTNIREDVEHWFRIARQKGKARGLLDAMVRVANQFRATDVGRARELARAICDTDARDKLNVADHDREYALLGSVVARCIDLQPGHNERARLLRNVISNGNSVFTVGKVYEHLKEVRALANLQGDDDDGPGQDIGQVFDELLRNRIVASATDPEFWGGARWFYLLELAWALDGREEVLECVEAHVRKDDDLLGFCEAFFEMRGDDDIGVDVGDAESKERGDIRSWLPKGAEVRLTRLAAEAEDEGTAVRAQWALVRS